MDARGPLRNEHGFTLVETLLAAAIMVGGLLALAGLMGNAATATFSTKAREQAVSLQRELIETARGVPYEQLVPGNVVAKVQASGAAGLADSGAGAGWTIRRRGVTYQVAVGACSVDDPNDGSGTHDAATFCALGAGTTPASTCATLLADTGTVAGTAAAASAGAARGDCGIDSSLDGQVDGLTEAESGVCGSGACAPSAQPDATPDDYKRIVTLVTWDRGSGKRYALQSTTVPNPGLSIAPVVTQLTTTSPNPVTSGTSVPFVATTDRAPAAVAWYRDGSPAGTASGSGTTWGFNWTLGTVSAGSAPSAGEVLDGPYVIGAKAFDTYGNGSASPRSLTIKLNRRAPYPPQRFVAGRNGSGVELEWSPARERDVEGFRVYRRPSDSSPNVQVCTLAQRTSCRDENPPSAATVEYYVVAVDRDPTGALREGTPSQVVGVTQTNVPPSPPTGLLASTSNGNTILRWTASPGDPDAGDAVDHYRIYRDGTAVADRYDRTSLGTDVTFTDTRTNGLQHDYWVVAVDRRLAESTKIGPVRK